MTDVLEGAMGERLLRIEDLTVSSRTGGTLVREVSLQLDQGQTLGIVGESGSGKSLTARSIVGLLPSGLRATGEASFSGTRLIGASERELRAIRGSRISLLLQDPFTMLNPLQTAGAHVGESLARDVRLDRHRRGNEIRRRLLEVGIEPDVADRYPFQLSGGMRQRVALAAALARDPQLLIADEPTTALDVTTQDEVLRLLKDVQERRGMALILITHDLRIAFSVCDRIQVMYAGSVVEQAPGDVLVSEPMHPYSLGLALSEPPTGHYVEELRSIPGNVPSADAVADVCAFASRCEWVRDPCLAARPPLVPVVPGRTSSCIRITEIRNELHDTAVRFEQQASTPPTPPSGMPIARLTDVCKAYRTASLVGRTRTAVALDRVSLEITSGESVGLVGETGSGKTTIARSILGLTTPDSGRIEIGDIDVSNYRRLNSADRRRVRKRVQVVFQDPYASLNPALTIGNALREVLDARGDVSDPTEEVATLLTQVGLPASYATRRPAALSGGERQRVAIARAIAMRPELLICDEPVAALDVSAQAQVLELLRALRLRYGMSMLFITHDLAVVRQMADRVVVLYHGEVVETGQTAQVLDAPQHPYTRRLTAAAPQSQPGRKTGSP
ncbi:ABC transporter ATP-binding protein [Prauserella coralliicola]|nr:ABC transporter ATP-binding protein [Prauserella coralliicola]